MSAAIAMERLVQKQSLVVGIITAVRCADCSWSKENAECR